MKILTVVWSIGIGGTERAAVNYAIGYKKFGVESKVLVLGEGYQRYHELINEGVETILVLESNIELEKIINSLKTWNPDIIHVHNYTDHLFKYINALKSPETRVVETNVFSRPNFGKTYSIIDLSMQLSSWGYWKYTGLQISKNKHVAVSVVPYIFIPTKFQRPANDAIQQFKHHHHIPQNAFVVGRLGQPHQSKWNRDLIKIMKKTALPSNSIFYLLVGVPTDLLNEIKLQSEFFQSRVKTIDTLEGDEQLALYYYSLDCFAHSSKIGESFGYVLVEAIQCGVPVITRITPLRDNAQVEIIGDHGEAVVSIRQFVSAVKQIYMAQGCASTIDDSAIGNSRFLIETVIPGLLKTYENLLKGNKIDSNFKKENINTVWNKLGFMSLYYKPAAYFINSPIWGLFQKAKHTIRGR